MSILKRIWNDPVVSGLITAFVIFICSTVYSSVKLDVNNDSCKDILVSAVKTPIFIVLIGLVILYTVYRLIRKRQFKYDQVSYDQDKALLDKITTKDLSSDFVEDFFRIQDFGSSFRASRLEPLLDFEYIKSNPNYKFNNPALEKIKDDLLSNITSFKDLVLRYTIVDENGVESALDAVKENECEFQKYKKRVNELANNICKNYDDLISTMRIQRVEK